MLSCLRSTFAGMSTAIEPLNPSTNPTLTVAELVEHLRVFPPDAAVFFGGSVDALAFFRTKGRGPGLVQIQFAQNVYRDGKGRLCVED